MSASTKSANGLTPKPDDFKNLGATGLVSWNGYVTDDTLPEMRGLRGRRIIREMREQDPVVSSVAYAVETLSRQVDWAVNPATEAQEDLDIATFVEECLFDMSLSWADTLAEILSFVWYGFSYHEIVYKRRGGPSEDPTQRSKHNDGRIGWRKFAIRSQETLDGWQFDNDGGVQGMYQRAAPNFERVLIPIDKSLLFRTTSNKGNPEGRSLLRGAYRPWYFKKHIENIEGIGIERDLAGLPTMGVPPELLDPNATPALAAAKQSLLDLVTSIRRDQNEGLLYPLAYDAHGNPRYKLELLSTGGSRQFDTDKIITRYDQRIAMSVLADFILLGHESVGSFALSSNKTHLFAVGLGAMLDVVAGTLNAHALPRLLRLNGMPTDRMPEVTHGDIESFDAVTVGTMLTAMAGAGAAIFPNPELEGFILEKMGLPAPVDGGLEPEREALPDLPDTVADAVDDMTIVAHDVTYDSAAGRFRLAG